MSLEKGGFGFFVVRVITPDSGFFIGDRDNPDYHPTYERFATLVVILIATVLKFGNRIPDRRDSPVRQPSGRPATDYRGRRLGGGATWRWLVSLRT